MPSNTELISLLIREMSPVLIDAYKVEASRSRIGKIETIQKEYLAGASVVNMAEGLKVKVSQCPACAAKIDKGHNHEVHTSHPVLAPKVLSIGGPMKTVGRATWNDFHTRADYFPEEPTLDDQEKIKEHIISSVTSLPCDSCTEHGLAYIAENPIDASSRAALQAWTCRFHDATNSKLGKTLHGCGEAPLAPVAQ